MHLGSYALLAGRTYVLREVKAQPSELYIDWPNPTRTQALRLHCYWSVVLQQKTQKGGPFKN